MNLHESGEMYLETIYVLSKTGSQIRSIDICKHMNFSKPSVSRAVNLLRTDRYIDIDGHGFITLTEKGLAIASKIYERHTLLTQFLIHLGVDEQTASSDACRIEHVISDRSFEAMKKHAHLMSSDTDSSRT